MSKTSNAEQVAAQVDRVVSLLAYEILWGSLVARVYKTDAADDAA